MKTKIYLQLNPIWQMLAMAILSIALLGLYSVIYIFKEDGVIPGILVSVSVAFCFYTFIRFEHDPIILRNDCITMAGDWLSKKEKIQYKVKISYAEIEQIQLIHTFKNSLGRSIARVPPLVSLTFMEFKCKGGKNKRLFILYHTKKQRIKIINEIKKRMVLVGNNADIGEAIDIVNNIIDK